MMVNLARYLFVDYWYDHTCGMPEMGFYNCLLDNGTLEYVPTHTSHDDPPSISLWPVRTL